MLSLKSILAFFRLSKTSLHNLGWMIASRGISIAIGLVTTAIVARNFSEATYGAVKLINSYFGIVSILAIPGLATSLKLAAAKNQGRGFHAVLRWKLPLLFLCSGVVVLIALFYVDVAEASQGLLLFAGILPFFGLSSVWQAWYRGKGWHRACSILDIVAAVLGLCLLLAVIFWLKSTSIYSLVLVTFSPIAVIAVYATIKAMTGANKVEHDKSDFRFGFYSTFATSAGVLLVTDKIIVEKYIGIEAVAILAIAGTLPSYLRELFNIINQLMTPKIFSCKTYRESWEYLRGKILKIFLIFAGISLLLIVALPVLIRVVFSEKYLASVPYAQWLVFWWGLSASFGYLSVILEAQKSRRFVFIHGTFYPVIFFACYNFFIPNYGLMGAIYSSYVSGVIMITISVSFFVYHLKKEGKPSSGVCENSSHSE